MNGLTEEEHRIVEAMARAMCASDGFDPDEMVYLIGMNAGMDFHKSDGSLPENPRWKYHERDARRQYVAYKEMTAALFAWEAATLKKNFNDIMGNQEAPKSCDPGFLKVTNG